MSFLKSSETNTQKQFYLTRNVSENSICKTITDEDLYPLFCRFGNQYCSTVSSTISPEASAIIPITAFVFIGWWLVVLSKRTHGIFFQNLVLSEFSPQVLTLTTNSNIILNSRRTANSTFRQHSYVHAILFVNNQWYVT